jgi:hypothetical protein
MEAEPILHESDMSQQHSQFGRYLQGENFNHLNQQLHDTSPIHPQNQSCFSERLGMSKHLAEPEMAS